MSCSSATPAERFAFGTSAERLAFLARISSARRYLEIGVNRGATFFHIDMPFKVAVDPHFLFEPAEHEKPGEHYCPVTSDDFFAAIADPASDTHRALASEFGGGAIAFDLVFIDGLHTFEQTLRDFENSMRFAHEKTLWLIDDTVPSDEFSAIPDRAISQRRRAMAGLPGSSWHGDVFKVVPAIHDLYPDFSYCTIIASNPQTAVWRAETRQGGRAFPSLGEISRMTCEDMLNNAAVFMPVFSDELPHLLGKSCVPSHARRLEARRRLELMFKYSHARR